jgi:hypothetical protein
MTEHPRQAEWSAASQHFGKVISADIWKRGLFSTAIAVVILVVAVMRDLQLRWLIVLAVASLCFVFTSITSFCFASVSRGAAILGFLCEEIERTQKNGL